MKQQESSPFTTTGESFERNYIMHGYYILIHHEGTICKNLSLFLYLYADFVIDKVSAIVMQSNYRISTHLK